MDTQRAFDLVKKLNFVRTSGTNEEKEAANILKKIIEDAGNKAILEEFKVDASNISKVSLDVLEPFKKSYEVTGVKMSSSTGVEGLNKELKYIEDGSDANLVGVEDKVVLLNDKFVQPKLYQKLLDKHVAGVILVDGSVYDKLEDSDLDQRAFREKLYKNGFIPAITIRALDAQELIVKKAHKVNLTIIQEQGEAISQNVVTTIEGNEYKDEIIAITAHYDSVPFSTGAYDNATGCAAIMELFHHLKEHQPKRTYKFIFCGSEEVGLKGSTAFLEAHKEELDKYCFNLNVDMVGVVLGKEIACCSTEEAFVHYLSYLANEIGMALSVRQGVYSSDSTPFADQGIPSVSFARISASCGAKIHSRKDVIDFITPEAFTSSLTIMEKCLSRLDKAIIFPIKKEIPENIKEELDYYMNRKERKEK